MLDEARYNPDMATVRTDIAYDGPALQAGAMDVRDFAPALLSFGDLCQQANRVLNGDRATVAVHVRADFKRGSFVVTVEVVQSLIAQIQHYLISDPVTATLQLAGLIGLGKVGFTSLLKLLKTLQGRQPESVVPVAGSQGHVRIQIDGDPGITIDVPEAVFRLYQDIDVRRAAEGVMRPLDQDGIDVFEIREDAEVIERVTKDDLPAFRVVGAAAEKEIGESEAEGVYTIVKLSFEERYKWLFSDGNASFSADIADETFFENVQQRRITFTSGDVLRVRLWKKTWQTDRGLRTEYVVRHVLEHIPALRQMPLPMDPNAARPRRRSRK